MNDLLSFGPQNKTKLPISGLHRKNKKWTALGEHGKFRLFFSILMIFILDLNNKSYKLNLSTYILTSYSYVNN